MTEQRGPRTPAVLLIAVVLLVSVVAPAAVAGAAVGGAAESGAVDRGATGYLSGGGSDVTRPSDREAVGPGLRSADGTVTVVVRFAGDARTGADASGGPGKLSTDDLRAAAADSQADFERFAAGRAAVTVEREFWLANAMLVTVDADRVPVERLLDVRGVERVHENFRVELDSAAAGSTAAADAGSPGSIDGQVASTDSTSTNATYGVDMVRAPEVWQEFGTRGEGATVAVLDTGIDPDHPDLTVDGWANFDDNGTLVNDSIENASDVDGHGTHVAGTVAGGNASGTAIGVAPEANLYGYKVLNDEGIGTFARVIGGMEYAADDPSVDVLQMSLGATGQFDEFIEPVQNARSAGKVVVASAGNGGVGSSSSPANVYDSFAVGAVNESRGVATFSSGETLNTSEDWEPDSPTGDWPDEYVVPDATAPGVAVYSAYPGGSYQTLSGTSMAAPHASGVAALMLSASTRNVTDDELYDTLRDTTNHPDNATEPDDRYGTGIVDGYVAVSSTTENRSTLTVTSFEAPNESAPGATVETTATVNNTGTDPGSGTVEYRFNDTIGDEANVSLQPNEETTVGFSYVVPANTTTNRTYEHGAYTTDSNLTSDISVVDGPFYEVTNLSSPSIVERNTTLETSVNVTNRGETAGENRTVELTLTDPGNESNASVLAATNATLGAGNGTTLSLNGTVPSEFDTGETTLTAASPDDGETAQIRIADAVGTVNGTVTDAEANATLPEIDVVVENGSEVVGETTTGGDGAYAVDVPAADLNVTASNATYRQGNASVTLNESGDVATANFSLTLRNGTLSGVVGATDDLDVPTNATVTVTNGTGDEVAVVDAADDGTYVVGLRPATYNVTADAPDFDSVNETNVAIEPNATTHLTFELDPKPATLSGAVTNASDGEPLGGATVTAVRTASGTTAFSNATDAGGNYSGSVERGEHDLTASADGYADVTETLTLSANESRETDFALSLPPEFTITGLSGSDTIKQGASGEFTVEVRNDGGTAGDVTVTFSDTATGDTRSTTFSNLAVDARQSTTFTVSIADDAETGSYDATASTPDDVETTSFEVTAADDGGGGGGGGGALPIDEEEPTDDPENETDDGSTEDPVDEPEDEDRTGDDGDDGDGGDDGGAPDNDGSTDGGDGDEPDAGTDAGTPGFGPLAVIVALLAVAGLGRRLDGE